MHERTGGPVTRLLNVVGSIWFGMTVLTVLFLYSSIGSAVPPIRQGALADWFGFEALRFEMTEMEWFRSRAFVALVLLFCISMTTATVRRIPLNLASLGVWMIHGGIIVLVAGCIIYFGRKIEGSAAVYYRSALLHAPGMTAPARLVIRPGAAIDIGDGDNRYHISVSRLMPRYEILTGDDKGKRTTAIWLDVQRPYSNEHPQFTRVLLADYPAYTEDVIVGTEGGPQRARKLLGRPLVDEQLRAELVYEPQDSFVLDQTAAIHARIRPDRDWVQWPVHRLPRYYEHLSFPEDVWPTAGAGTARGFSIDAARPASPPKGLDDISFRVVGYLPYATMTSRWVDGGATPNPVLRFSVGGREPGRQFEMLANDPQRSRIVDGGARATVEFLWAESAEQREQMAATHSPRLRFTVPGRTEPVEIALRDLLDRDPQPILDTGYSACVKSGQVMPDFPLLSPSLQGKRDSVLVVEVKHGDKSFRRLVYATHEAEARDLDDVHKPLAQFVDPAVKIRFLDPSPAGLRLIAGPTADGCDIVFSEVDGTQLRWHAKAGESVVLREGTAPLRIDAIVPRAREEARPAIVPRRERQPMQSVGAAMSMIEVEVRHATTTQRVWLPFNAYVFADENYAYPERFQFGSYAPRTVTLGDGRALELLYAPERRYLPAAIALDRFVLETHPGGTRERDFISLVRFREDSHWSEQREIRSNQPAEYKGLWLFQSQWDPENEALTILGIGNREGVTTMLTGTCLSIIGMIYAFYVKPVIRRRQASRAASGPGVSPASSAASRAGVLVSITLLGVLAAPARAEPPSFEQAVDVSKVRLLAVQHDGRVKTFDTLAREVINEIAGTTYLDGQDPVFTYMDMMLRPAAYFERNLVYVRKTPVRESLMRAAASEVSADVVARIRETKRVSLAFLTLPSVQTRLAELDRDVMTTGKDVDALRQAVSNCQGDALRSIWRIVPPPGGSTLAPWLAIDEATGGVPNDAAHAGVTPRQGVNGADSVVADAVRTPWRQLADAWQTRDASSANAALAALANTVSRIEPRLYPTHSQLALEHWYYRNNKLTWGWIVYAAAVPLLLMAAVNRWGPARRTGMLLFVLAFAVHTLSIAIRWRLAGRIPNSNMFEAVTAAAWFGGLLAWILEATLRRHPMRCLFALGASVCAMSALMCGYFMPIALNSSISTPMPILQTVWLKIHTNLILVSYTLIGLGFVTAAVYLALRAALWLSKSAALSRLLTGVEPVGSGPPATILLHYDRHQASPGASDTGGAPATAPLSSFRRTAFLLLSVPGSVVLAALLWSHVQATISAANAALSAGNAFAEWAYAVLLLVAIVGGPALLVWLVATAASIVFGPDPNADLVRRSPLAAMLDGSTMLLMEVAFVTLWVGIILGAAWADVSWGRPWGWDPKEVFALNTWIVFLILVHIRLKVRDKGLWTAVLAIIGFVVMMFNWIGVNFFIVGLHSYA